MKNFSIVAAIVFVLAVPVASNAQPHKLEISDLANILATLRLEPISEDICTIHARYNGMGELRQALRSDPKLQETLRLSEK